MREFLISIVVTAVIGAGVVGLFAGAGDGEGQADAALAATPQAPSPDATAFPIATPRGGGAPSGGGGGPASPGQALATRLGCLACHSTTGASGVGPSWKGISGTSVTLADGSTATRDDAYLRESITNPNAKVVRGFNPGIMPQNFAQTLTPEQITELVDYIKTLQ